MKISQMILREDFYEINEKTLCSFFGKTENKKTRMFIYPQLNAIVSETPSNEVVDYLLCEYSVRGNKIKQLAAYVYVFLCMKSHGLFSKSKCIVQANLSSSILIYPCNKKYRIFNFEDETVSVISKHGFDDSDLQHEIEFRKRKHLPEFVPGLVSYDEKGYKERIIDGRPLARITEGFETFRDEAYQCMLNYGSSQQRTMNAEDYADKLLREIKTLAQKKASDIAQLNDVAEKLAAMAEAAGKVTLSFSHGDLQPGNIWVENGTKHIYIIDWESWAERSIWYDHAALYQEMRGSIKSYLAAEIPLQERAVVLLEDLVFRLHEINSLPKNFGVAQFAWFVGELVQWLKVGE